MIQQTVPVVEELFHDRVMVRVLECCFMDSVFCNLEDFRERVGHDDWRMGGDDELGPIHDEFVNPRKH